MDPPSRRDFLRSLPGAMLAAMHVPAICGAVPASAAQPDGTPLIRSLRLQTAAPLEEMRRFYHEVIGLTVADEGVGHLTVRAGRTLITFVAAGPDDGKPFYHFAFNIPQNKLMRARQWHLERWPLIPAWGNLRDPEFPEDVIHFRNWNAHSLFFWDPAQNIVEYIARHELENDAGGEFSAADILYASEIGFVVDDQQGEARQLNRDLGLGVYPQGTNHWWAMGDALGLLLCVPNGRSWGTHTDTPKQLSIYRTEATIRGDSARVYTLGDYPYKVSIMDATPR